MSSLPYFSLSHHSDQDVVYSHWLRTVNSDEYRHALLSVCDLIDKSNASHWLADLSKTTSPNISDQNWATQLLGKSLQKTHIRKIAFVLPNDLFLEVVTEKASTKLVKLTKNEIQIARFSDIDSAQRWLDSCSELDGLFRYDSLVSN